MLFTEFEGTGEGGGGKLITQEVSVQESLRLVYGHRVRQIPRKDVDIG